MGMTPYNDTEYYRYDEDLNIVDPYGVVIQRRDKDNDTWLWTSAGERRNQEKENFAKRMNSNMDLLGDVNSLFRVANNLSYYDWSKREYVNTSAMSMADELKYRNDTGQWGQESNLNYLFNSITTVHPHAYATNSNKIYQNQTYGAFNGINDGLDDLSLYEKHLVGKSDGYLRAFQSAARLADKRRLAEQDAITQAATSGSFAGTPWEKNGQTGSLINL